MVQDFVHQQYYVTSSKKILRAWAHWKGWFVITDLLTRTTLVSVISLANLILQYIVCRACWENIKHPPLACSTPKKINFMDKMISKDVYINLSLHHLGGIYKMFFFSNGWSIFPMFLVLASCNKILRTPSQKSLAAWWRLALAPPFNTGIISWPAKKNRRTNFNEFIYQYLSPDMVQKRRK